MAPLTGHSAAMPAAAHSIAVDSTHSGRRRGTRDGRAKADHCIDAVPFMGLRPALSPVTLCLWDGHTRSDEMESAKRRERTRPGHRGGREPRVVAIELRPTPDAEARLLRLAAILLDHATRAASQAGDGERPEVQ